MNDRMQGLQRWLKEQGCAAAFITPGTNFFYLTGWRMNPAERLTGLLLPAEGSPALIVPALEREAAGGAGVAEIHAWPDGTDPYRLVEDVIRKKAIAGECWAFEKEVLTLGQYERLAAVTGARRSCDAGAPLGAMRLRKDAAEIALMQRAADYLNPALDSIKRVVRPGMTERQVLSALTQALEDAGSQGMAFSAAVLSGSNSALPHGKPGARPIERGDYLLIDFGGVAGGYCSDITRTFIIGGWDAERRKVYDTVLAAHDAALAAARPGVPCAEVDRAARRVIEAAGYGQYFVHRVGHGLGLDVHEAPYMTGENEQLLEPGMVFTVEPGIYIPGWGGVRIEENVVVTEDGCRVLTTYPNDADSMVIG